MSEKQTALTRAFAIETALLKAMSIRETYDNYEEYVTYDKLLEETQTILYCYKHYYKLYPERKEIDFNSFITHFSTTWHSTDMTKEDLVMYQEAIRRIGAADAVESETVLLGLINKQLVDAIKILGEKDFTPEDIHKKVEEYEIRRSGVLSEFDRDCFKLEDIDLSIANPTDGVPYAHSALQDALFGQVQGDLIIVNAHHGLGKSALMITQMVHTFLWLHANKIHLPIVYFNSEGSAAQLFGRFLSCLYRDQINGGYKDILAQQDRVKRHFFKNFNGDMLKIYRSNGRGFGFVRDKIKKYGPCVVFIDMLKGAVAPAGKNQSETSGLEDFAQRLRDLSSVTCPIWASVQAGDSSMYWDKESQSKRHKRWPDSTDIYGSKTGIQGAASTIISIGMDDNRPLTRFCHTTKIKAEENAKFICTLEKKFSYYKETEWSPSIDVKSEGDK